MATDFSDITGTSAATNPNVSYSEEETKKSGDVNEGPEYQVEAAIMGATLEGTTLKITAYSPSTGHTFVYELTGGVVPEDG